MSDGIVVRGGMGGTAATLQRMRHAAAVLRTAADHLDAAAGSARWAARVGLGPAAPVTGARAQAAVEPVVHGPGSLVAHAAATRDLGSALTRAADAYDRAEGAAADALRTALATVGQQAGDRPVAALLGGALLARLALPGLLVVGGALHATGRGSATVRRLATTDPTEGAVQVTAGFVRALAPGTQPVDATPAVGASRAVTSSTGILGLAAPELARRPLQVAARLGRPSTGVPPRDAADVLRSVAALYPRAGGVAGTVGVDRLDHADGTRTWVVAIPGTQDATSFGAGANPMDMATNARLMAQVADDGTQLVARALDAAGARPGESVLLAGHSQGGMVAMALAGSAAFTARHRVVAVLTAGSPVATRAGRAGTAVLHLEHRQDLVPALDGRRNPDRPDRTTAVRDLAASPDPADRLVARSPGGAHGVDAYARTARAVGAHGGPSVRAWERAAATVLGGPGVVVVHREFTGEREPVRPRAQVLAPGPGPGLVSARGPGSPR